MVNLLRTSLTLKIFDRSLGKGAIITPFSAAYFLRSLSAIRFFVSVFQTFDRARNLRFIGGVVKFRYSVSYFLTALNFIFCVRNNFLFTASNNVSESEHFQEFG